MSRLSSLGLFCVLASLSATGCATNSQSENGALVGGGAGALIGGIVGHQLHNTAAGAVIGGAAGAVTGAVVGNKMDENDAKNRAIIESRLGHPIGAGGVTNEDVIAMTKAGVDTGVIVSHVNNNGIARPLTAADITYLTQSGVNPAVIQAMQNPARAVQPVIVQQAPPPVIVEERYDPYWGPRYYRPYPYYGCRPAVGVGVVVR